MIFLCGRRPSLQCFSDVVFDVVDVFGIEVGGTRCFRDDDKNVNIADDDLLIAVEKVRLFCALCGVEEEDAIVGERCGQVTDTVDPAGLFVERREGVSDPVREGFNKGRVG